MKPAVNNTFPLSLWERAGVRAVGILILLLCTSPASAQSFRVAGTEFEAMRKIEIPSGSLPPVVVTEFYHHGLLSPDGKNLVVVTKNRKLAATRILQQGPGDFCRVAFETVAGQTSYDLLYGGDPPDAAEIPPRTNTDGLLLETRRYKPCTVGDLASVRAAFDSAEPIGSDYVDAVHHSSNPFSLSVGPFLSKYSGTLHIAAPGTFGFLVSAQDACFLLVDGKEVISRQGILRRATPGTRKDIRLTAGPHKFEYYHVTARDTTQMVAAWEIAPSDDKPKPAAIPGEVFRIAAIGRAQAGPVALRDEPSAPDFLISIGGDVPLPDNERPLVGVQFVVPKSLPPTARLRWQFGDGQTSTERNPVHVYLQPGLYPVTLALERSRTRAVSITNRIAVDRPQLFRPKDEQLHTLDQYLPVLDTYDPATLPAPALLQYVAAYLAKSDQIQAEIDELKAAETAALAEQQNLLSESVHLRETGTAVEAVSVAAEAKERAADARKLAAEAAAMAPKVRAVLEKLSPVGLAAFSDASPATGDEELLQLARLVGPVIRDRLGDSPAALTLWKAAAGKVTRAEIKAECQTVAADIATNDTVRLDEAKTLLDEATKHLQNVRTGNAAAALARVRGDYDAATGQTESARKAYAQAEAILGRTRAHTERTAWQGARSRSTEEFLASGQLDRAIGEIRLWQREFPSEKVAGYLTFLHARYWADREMYPQAISLAEQLLTVNAASPYADQLLLLAARCEGKRGRPDAALAYLKSILADYPGSPLVPQVRGYIEQLESAP